MLVPLDLLHPKGLIQTGWFPDSDDPVVSIQEWIDQAEVSYGPGASDNIVRQSCYVRAYQFVTDQRRTGPMITQYADHREEYDRYQLAALEKAIGEAQDELDKEVLQSIPVEYPPVSSPTLSVFPRW